MHLLHTEAVAGLHDVRVVAGAKDLLLLTSPAGLVDGINVVLDLEHDAAVLGNGAREVRVIVNALGLLERHGTVLAAARVHLEGLLVGVDVELDAGPV